MAHPAREHLVIVSLVALGATLAYCSVSGRPSEALADPIVEVLPEARLPVEGPELLPEGPLRSVPGPRVRVLDPHRAPIDQAGIWPADLVQRHSADEPAAKKSGSDGIIPLAPSDVGRRFGIRKAGYVSAVIPALATGVTTVTLPAAHDLTVTCVDLLGKPVAGVRIAMSRMGFSDEDLMLARDYPLPGFDSRTAIHSHTSSSDGVARLTDLPSGLYGLEVSHPYMGLISGSRDVEIPSPPLELVFADFLAAVVTTGDQAAIGQALESTGDWSRVVHGHPDAGNGYRLLADRYPGAKPS